MSADLLLPSREERIALWSELVRQAESYLEGVESLPVAPALMQSELHKLLDGFSFDDPGSRLDVLRRFTEDMKRHQVHTPHPCYFGLFNPAPAFMGILGESIAATLNPQLAAWSHSPLAVETERRMVDAFARKFGFSEESADGCLTSGGAEANLTALLCALNERWPGVLDNGLQGISARPTFYASAESHHSFLKAARTAGLGRGALRTVPVTDALQMDCDALQRMIAEDRGHGYEPFLVVGTAGTTGAGIVDPLGAMHNVARANGLWFHVDAAWGGAAVLVPELRPVLSGIETADSITFDPHKYLSMPMGAGMFLTRHREHPEQNLLCKHCLHAQRGRTSRSCLRTTRLLRWLVACGRLVQLLLQLQQLAQLLNIGGVGCWNAPRTWLQGTLIGLGCLLEDHVDRSIRRNRHHDVLGDR
jgi:glutamate/tyrosine decarboxylase-like PLP-dependent enzyme